MAFKRAWRDGAQIDFGAEGLGTETEAEGSEVDVGGHAGIHWGAAGVRDVVRDSAVLLCHILHIRHYLGSFGDVFYCSEGATKINVTAQMGHKCYSSKMGYKCYGSKMGYKCYGSNGT